MYKIPFITLICLCSLVSNTRPRQTGPSSGQEALNALTETITPEKFGCKGDGTTDDTDNLQKAIDHCKSNNRRLISTKGKIYIISSPLNFTSPGEMQVDFGGAEIKAASPMEHMIEYDNKADYNTRHNNIINNITLDCNNMSGGIYCRTAIKTSFNFIMIRNCSKKAFALESGYEVFLTNSHIHCNTGKDSYGLYLKTGDSHFDNIAIIDAHTAVFQKTGGVNFFDKVHAWLYNNVEGSTFFNISGLALLNQCYADTAEKGYNINGFAILTLNNCQYYNNPNCYDSPNNPVIFSYDSEDLSKTSSITCTGCSFNAGGLNASICNYDKHRIQFHQCFIDATINGFIGKDRPTASKGISFNRAVVTIEDNNTYWPSDNDTQSNHLYIDANVEKYDKQSKEIEIATLPPSVLPSDTTFGSAVMIYSDGCYTQSVTKVSTDGSIKILINNTKKDIKRIIINMSYY